MLITAGWSLFLVLLSGLGNVHLYCDKIRHEFLAIPQIQDDRLFIRYYHSYLRTFFHVKIPHSQQYQHNYFIAHTTISR